MSSHLSKELKTKYDVRSIPVRKGDTVKVMRGTCKGREGKVQAVYRKRWALHIEKVTREKTNGKKTTTLINLICRNPSTNPNSRLPSSCYCSQARQGQKGSFRKKEESCQGKEQAQGRIGWSRLRNQSISTLLFLWLQIKNLSQISTFLFIYIYSLNLINIYYLLIY